MDGKAVQNGDQLRCLRREYTLRTGEAQDIPLTVYRYGQYLQLKDTTADLGVSDYTAAQTAQGNLPFIVIPSKPLAQAQRAEPRPELASTEGLRLNGISGAPPNRLAVINGKTLAAGESTSIRLANRTVTVRCLSISEASASVAIDGENRAKELYLGAR